MGKMHRATVTSQLMESCCEGLRLVDYKLQSKYIDYKT